MSQHPRPRPKRILLLAMHSGYIRNYERTIRLLLEEGHEVHVAVVSPTKQSVDRVAERMANEYLNLTVSRAPKGSRGNVDNLRRALRGLADYMRYQHPRFADATALRERASSKLLKRRNVCGLLPAVGITLYLPTLGRIRNARYADAMSRWSLRLANSLPPPSRPTRWLRGLAPDVFLTTPHVAIWTSDPEFLDAARALGIPSALLIASWDNLTNKGLIKSPADLVVVWNEAQRAEAIELHRVPAHRIAITGAQRFDDWFEISTSSAREDFVGRIGLDAGKPYILYLCSSPFIAPDEVPFVRRLALALRSSEGPLKQAGLLIRPHPQNAQQWANVDVSEYGNAVIWPREGEQPVRDASKQGFYDSMYHSLAVVGINTSAQIEAGIIGRTVHTVLDPQFADAQEGTLHFRHLLVEHGGLLYVASDLPELVRNLESVLEGGLREDHAQRFVANFIRPHGASRPASPLVADAIRRLVDGPPRSSVEIVPPSLVERLLLALLIALSIPTEPVHLRAAVRNALRSAPARAAARVLAGCQPLLRRLRVGGPRHLAQSDRPSEDGAELVIIEPWHGDLASEVLYWIPVLRRYRRSLPWDARVIVVTNDADPRWYSTLESEAVLHERDLDIRGWSREEFTNLLGAQGEVARPRFYGPSREAEELGIAMRADSLPWAVFERATEIRSLLARGTRIAEHETADWIRVRPSLVRDVLSAAEAGESMAVALRPTTADDGDEPDLLKLDLCDRRTLTTGLEDAVVAISTDVGVAALAVTMGVGTTLVRGVGAGAGHDADLDVLDRVAASLEVEFEIIEPAALGALLLGDGTVARR